MNTNPIPGLHHVTAIAGNPQQNLDFYTEVLGLRFVKKTVNFDDPGTYHFYFGDDAGSPGTILTFFPWPHATRGTRGAGEVTQTAFSIPPASLAWWELRLAAKGIQIEARAIRFGEPVLAFSDPDGMQVELVGHEESVPVNAPRFADVPAQHAIRGFFGVTLLERELAPSAAALNLLGFHQIAEENGRTRFSANGNALGNHIDVVLDPTARRGRPGAGTVHHIAFRSISEADQKLWLARIQQHLATSPVMDRDYFRSIYFREPGGVLFELATDTPGFAIDEPLESLGESLRVPAWLQSHLEQIDRNLPSVTLHKSLPAREEVLA